MRRAPLCTSAMLLLRAPIVLAAPRAVVRLSSTFAGLPAHVEPALRTVVDKLKQNRLPYCVAGAVACNAWGHKRATQDIDLIVNQEDLNSGAIAKAFDGNGFRVRFAGALRSWKETRHGVNLFLITSGDYPGDGLPKPVSFPHLADEPNTAADVDIDGVRVLNLCRLIEVRSRRSAASATAWGMGALFAQSLCTVLYTSSPCAPAPCAQPSAEPTGGVSFVFPIPPTNTTTTTAAQARICLERASPRQGRGGRAGAHRRQRAAPGDGRRVARQREAAVCGAVGQGAGGPQGGPPGVVAATALCEEGAHARRCLCGDRAALRVVA